MQATLRSDVYELPFESRDERAPTLAEADALAWEMSAARTREGGRVKETTISANETLVKVTVKYRPAA